MARARNIKPAFFTNEQLVELGFDRRLLFIGLWTLADREGRLEDRPKQIKMAIFPADNVDVDKALDELQDAELILRYQAGAKRYIQVLTFAKHQNPHHREPPSTIPKPEALPPMQHGESLRLDTDGNTPKPEAQGSCKPSEASGEPSASPSTALLIPDSLLLIPDSDATPHKRGNGHAKPGAANRSPVPEEFDVDEGLWQWALDRGIAEARIMPETEKFLNHHKGKGSLQADWRATWRTWMLNSLEFRK